MKTYLEKLADYSLWHEIEKRKTSDLFNTRNAKEIIKDINNAGSTIEEFNKIMIQLIKS